MEERPARKPRSYSRQMARQMFQRIAETHAANLITAQEDHRYRSTDPFEVAKTALRRRGYIVFPQSLCVPGSNLIVVGQKTLSVDEVLALAERVCPRTPKEQT